MAKLRRFYGNAGIGKNGIFPLLICLFQYTHLSFYSFILSSHNCWWRFYKNRVLRNVNKGSF